MRLQVCGANKFQLDLVRQSDVDVLALRVTTSRAIDLSLRNRWNCFGPRPRPHKQREETHAQYQLGTEAKISMRAANVGMLFYYYNGHQGVGRWGAKCEMHLCSGDIACPRWWPHSRRAITLGCAISALKWPSEPSPWDAPILILLAANINFLEVHPHWSEKILCAPRYVLYLLIIYYFLHKLWFKILKVGLYKFLIFPPASSLKGLGSNSVL